jgi:uncharacterized membrane protein YdjX (TVP38/TMEM64 family)
MQLFNSSDAKKKTIIAIFLIIFILIVFIVLVFPILKYLIKPSQLKIFVLQFGVWAPIAFILLQTLQMLFLIIPGAPFLVAGGYIFGNIGIIYSIIGIMIGSVIVFELGRLFGRPFLESVVDKKAMAKIDNQSSTVEKTLFVLYLIPPLPHDVFSFIAGVTKISLKKYILISFVGRLPLIIFYSLIGYQLTKLNLFYSLLLLIIIVVGSIIIFYNKDQIEDNIHKYTKKFEKK